MLGVPSVPVCWQNNQWLYGIKPWKWGGVFVMSWKHSQNTSCKILYQHQESKWHQLSLSILIKLRKSLPYMTEKKLLLSESTAVCRLTRTQVSIRIAADLTFFIQTILKFKHAQNPGQLQLSVPAPVKGEWIFHLSTSLATAQPLPWRCLNSFRSSWSWCFVTFLPPTTWELYRKTFDRVWSKFSLTTYCQPLTSYCQWLRTGLCQD